jgi:apolipoprotein N-acyltransferase
MPKSSELLSLPLPWRLALAAVAGLLLAAGYALQPLWWAPWLAPALLIPAVSGDKRYAHWMGTLVGLLSILFVARYYLSLSGIGLGLLILVLLRVLSWRLAARMIEMALRKLPPVCAVFMLSVLMAALETLTLIVSVHGAAGSLAYSQMEALPVIQLAAMGGVPLIVFVVLLPGSLLGVWIARRTTSSMHAPAIAVATLLAAAGLFAGLRLSASPLTHHIPATLIVTDRFDGEPKDWNTVWRIYQPQIAAHAAIGGVTVLPEKIALLEGASIAQAEQDVRAAAQAARATLVIGVETHADGIYRNRALIAAPDGSLRAYDKQRLVPGFEARDTPGKTPLLVPVAGQTMGVDICKDMHIPSIGRDYAQTAAFMAVPAWDFQGSWGQDGWMGARMTMMRGIESGYAIARSARNGYLGVYDAYGRVIAEAPSSTQISVVQTNLPAGQVATPYARIGDAFGWLCCLLLAAAIVALRVRPDHIS